MEANIKRITFDERGNLKEVELYEGKILENFWPSIEFIRKQLYYLNQQFPQVGQVEIGEKDDDG